MPIDRLILLARGSFWKSSFNDRIGSPANGSMCSNMAMGAFGGTAFDYRAPAPGQPSQSIQRPWACDVAASCHATPPWPSGRATVHDVALASLSALDSGLAGHQARDS